MAFEFHAMRDRVQHDVWLNTDFFAEEIILRPLAGPDVPMTVHISDDQNMDFEEPGSNKEVERLRVLISRVTDETNTKGYLVRPVVGMQLLRDTDHDPFQEPYVFNGEIESVRPSKWRLVFERERQISTSAHR